MKNIEESTFVLRKLTATSEGTYLTQASLPEDEPRVYAKTVFLGQNQSPDYWREASEQERQDYLNSLPDEDNIQ